jgi:hypothetical protein
LTLSGPGVGSRLSDCELQLSGQGSAEKLAAYLTCKNLGEQRRNSVAQLPLSA